MSIYPTQLALSPDQQLQITWSDGRRDALPVRLIRDQCPCATCREKRAAPPPPPTLLPVLSAAEAQPLRLLGMEPVGNYAYSLHFSDGHDTGIFTFEMLRQLAEEPNRPA
ncbi:MAG: DUF971 domain-containing protein [Planctomycetaceae bacterium]|nr:DUF971 domain-containing protein [Planctomycetaceae bacterium]